MTGYKEVNTKVRQSEGYTARRISLNITYIFTLYSGSHVMFIKEFFPTIFHICSLYADASYMSIHLQLYFYISVT